MKTVIDESIENVVIDESIKPADEPAKVIPLKEKTNNDKLIIGLLIALLIAVGFMILKNLQENE